MIVAATPRPFHLALCALFLFPPLPRKIDMQQQQQCGSKPPAPQPASGGLRRQWPSSIQSHPRVP
jgi:hypothetical protein